ncbi:hypothetical protein U1Q18_003598 [Sarracenia purpurea var. burkii]
MNPLNAVAEKRNHFHQRKKKSPTIFPPSLPLCSPKTNGILIPAALPMSSFTPTTVGGGGRVLPPTSTTYLNNLGLGYAIAVALGFLVLLSIIILTSYLCCRTARHRSRHQHNLNPNTTSSDNGILLPAITSGDNNENAVVGLDASAINSYPKFMFSKEGGDGIVDSACSICLCEYRDGEMVRILPECRHFFHPVCIDAWLKLNASCPVCRNSPLPTPLSTPLSEVVPLSQYSGDRRR